MPMNGTTYVAPTWRNGGPPALDPAELQAMCDTIAGNQGKNLSQDSLIAALQTAVGGKGQIEVGSYVGTGTYGADNPNSITCSFAPKLVAILYYIPMSEINSAQPTHYRPLFGSSYAYNSYGSYTINPEILSTSYKQFTGFIDGNAMDKCYAKISSDGKTISWYGTLNGSTQLNETNAKYGWIAFG